MGNFKNYYVEGILAIVLLFSSYYAITSIKEARYNQKVLCVAKSKLALKSLDEHQNIEKNLEENKTDYISKHIKKILISSGFEIIEIKNINNSLLINVKKNEAAKKIAKTKMSNLHFSDINSDIVQVSVKNNKENSINLYLQGICFFGPNDWQVFINNKSYDNNNRKINDCVDIIKVTQDFVKIISNEEEITLYIS